VPLGAAAQNGHLHTVVRLLEGGANMNYQNKVRSTCYMKYALYYNMDMGRITVHGLQ